jgi:hypothetical protein
MCSKFDSTEVHAHLALGVGGMELFSLPTREDVDSFSVHTLKANGVESLTVGYSPP